MAANSFSSPPGLTVTRACRKRNGVLADSKDSTSLPGLPAMLNPRPATARVCLPGLSWHTGIGLAGQPVIGWVVFYVDARTRAGDVSGVYLFAVREIFRAIQY
jgi:hypothetical protein